jgi:hypothetical protein
LVSPLLTAAYLQTLAGDALQHSGPKVSKLNTGEYWITLSDLIFHCEIPEGSNQSDRLLLLRYSTIAPQIIPSQLRFLARQASAATRVVVIEQCTIAEVPPIPREVRESRGLLRENIIATAVTCAHLETLGALPLDFLIPVPEDVLLDAIAAHFEGDDRKAILYACIAIESLATEVLDAAYQALLWGDRNDPRYRIVETKISKGELRLQDPVYEALKRGDSFRGLFHERPLYLLGKSLFLESQDTYSAAHKLQQSRSQIAHAGYSDGADPRLGMHWGGSRTAIETAIEVFRWFGRSAGFDVSCAFIEPLPS